VTLAFWDSSAFVKLLVDEAGSDDAERVWNEAESAAASRLAVPEVTAALSAARRSGRLTATAHRRSLREWARLQDELDMVELTSEVSREAADLATSYPLSGADAVHLASAVSLERAGPILVTWDRRLASAAVSVGLAVAPGGF
jgi:predicted nucleic acid-binding protein